tara:strand:- start:501 stop:635 length:135 start_codon:yes stop_codon:yes gene_type:complete
MKKGTVAKAVAAKPLMGKKDTSRPAGPGKVIAPYTPAGRKGKKK